MTEQVSKRDGIGTPGPVPKLPALGRRCRWGSGCKGDAIGYRSTFLKWEPVCRGHYVAEQSPLWVKAKARANRTGHAAHVPLGSGYDGEMVVEPDGFVGPGGETMPEPEQRPSFDDPMVNRAREPGQLTIERKEQGGPVEMRPIGDVARCPECGHAAAGESLLTDSRLCGAPQHEADGKGPDCHCDYPAHQHARTAAALDQLDSDTEAIKRNDAFTEKHDAREYGTVEQQLERTAEAIDRLPPTEPGVVTGDGLTTDTKRIIGTIHAHAERLGGVHLASTTILAAAMLLCALIVAHCGG